MVETARYDVQLLNPVYYGGTQEHGQVLAIQLGTCRHIPTSFSITSTAPDDEDCCSSAMTHCDLSLLTKGLAAKSLTIDAIGLMSC